MSPQARELLRRIDACLAPDRARLRSRFDSIRGPDDPLLPRLREDLAAAERRLHIRLAMTRDIAFPDDLPVASRRDEIAKAITNHQVVVVCGETGSGKTTQLPKICLSLGRGVHGLIGHTQPRRIAARSVASRIAEELRVRLGDGVGYKVRFGDHTSDATCVKVMTDGILLAETAADRNLSAYDTIIIDEAHERSLNIDFLLGYLKTLLPRRPDLKVIITSATIDPERFSRHFENAPIISVAGRTYPVEVLYRPLHAEGLDERDEDVQSQIVRAVDEAASYGDGDILIFLSGEREIRETAETLEKHHVPGAPGTEILPLYAKLTAEEQMKVFRTHDRRRIVLATNVAETSLTVPGIRFVIDTGVARISRYAPRTKVQRLEVEAISRASADQRKGRCGRIGPGVCFRLYSEEDFASRAEFTDPEILRANLASVILQMTALRLGDIEQFPFVEPPDPRLIRDGFDTLVELGAIDASRTLTPIGRDLARLPIDPRIGRLLLAAREEPTPALADVLVIAAALSVQDPRERPLEKQAQADQAHAQFKDPRSDFFGFLRLWDWYRENKRHLSQSKLRRLCRDTFVSFVRLREWEDIHNQLAEQVGSIPPSQIGTTAGGRVSNGQKRRPSPAPTRASTPLHLDARARSPKPTPKAPEIHHRLTERTPLPPPPAEGEKPDKALQPRADAIHRALLTGLLSNIGLKAENGEYAGARAIRFHIFPGSALFKAGPRWVMAAELVRTTRLFARTVAPTDPEWIERAAGHLVTRAHFDPHWDARSGRVMAFERVQLFGLELVARRRVHYAPVDPVKAREVFIRGALVEGGMLTRAEFFEHNMKLLQDLERMQVRARRSDLVADAFRRHEFYANRIPPAILTTHDFERWHKSLTGAQRDALCMSAQDIAEPGVDIPTKADFPDVIEVGRARLPLEYHLEPLQPADGVTVRIPLEAVAQLSAERFHWLVPGHLRTKVDIILRGLPKDYRRLLPPGQTLLDAVFPRLRYGEGSLFEQLRAAVREITTFDIPRDAFERVPVPDHLQMRFEVLDPEGKSMVASRDLAAIRAHLAAQLKNSGSGEVRHGAERFNRNGITSWDFGDLPERVEVDRFGTIFVTFPAIIDQGTAVGLRLFDHQDNALAAGRAGLRRLFMLDAGEEVRRATHRHPDIERLAVLAGSLGSPQAFRQALIERSVDRALGADRDLPRTKAEFVARSRDAVHRLSQGVREVCDACEPTLRAAQAVLPRLSVRAPAAWEATLEDIRSQIAALLPANFPAITPWDSLRHLPRYLAAIDMRLQRLGGQGGIKDQARLAEITPIWKGYHELVRRQKELGLNPRRIEEYRWLVEELRVSLFAQELKTAVPVSVKRLHDAWEGIVKG